MISWHYNEVVVTKEHLISSMCYKMLSQLSILIIITYYCNVIYGLASCASLRSKYSFYRRRMSLRDIMLITQNILL